MKEKKQMLRRKIMTMKRGRRLKKRKILASQKRKQVKKIANKKLKKVGSSSGSIKKAPLHNIKQVPQNCKHLVNEDDVIYVVPGDGSCGPSSAAVFLFNGEVFGPKLRIRMNLFMAKHWYKRYQNVTQCSPGHPFVRKIGDGKIEITEPKNLIKFLKSSNDAAYMWSDSEDLYHSRHVSDQHKSDYY